jgi:hypothetical protein
MAGIFFFQVTWPILILPEGEVVVDAPKGVEEDAGSRIHIGFVIGADIDHIMALSRALKGPASRCLPSPSPAIPIVTIFL